MWRSIFSNLLTALLIAGFVAIPFVAPDIAKWLTIFVISALGAILAAFGNWRLAFRLTLPESTMLLGLFLIFGLHLFLHPSEDWIFYVMQKVGFIVLVFAFVVSLQGDPDVQNRFQGSLGNWVFIVTLGMLGLAIVQLLQVVEYSRPSYLQVVSGFSHVNQFAQFLGLSLIFQLQRILVGSVKTRRLLIPLAIVTLVFLVLTLCRSVWIASLMSCGLLLLSQKTRPVHFGWKSLSLLVLSIAGVFVYSGFLSSVDFIFYEKALNSSFRLDLWKNTLYLIWQNPLGVGPGNFEAAISVIRNYSLDSHLTKIGQLTPHNEFFRIAAENGLVYFGVAIFLGKSLLFGQPIVTLTPQGREKVHQKLFIGALLMFFAVDSFFQATLMTPFPYFVFAFFWANLLNYKRSAKLSKRQGAMTY